MISVFAIFAFCTEPIRGRPPPTSSPVKLRVKSCVNNPQTCSRHRPSTMVVESTNQAALGTPKTHTLPRQLPKTPQKVFKPHWVSRGAKADNVRIPCALKPQPQPQPPSPAPTPPAPAPSPASPGHAPQPPARATSPQPSRAQPSPAKKCSPAQPSPAPLPANKPKHGFKKKNSVKTFGQNFRSKRYWHPNP